jgi:hypothetical protein
MLDRQIPPAFEKTTVFQKQSPEPLSLIKQEIAHRAYPLARFQVDDGKAQHFPGIAQRNQPPFACF